MQFADLGARRLAYVRQGSGEPLLLIQGMAGHHGVWGDAFLDALAADFDVVAFDHRGVGDSTDVGGEFTIADLADDAALVLDALDWPAAHVMGISMGGMVAQELAIRHPDRVRTLVLGCTYAGGAGSALDAPGPMEMFQAMQTGDIEAVVKASYTANLSSAYTDDQAHYEPFRAASLSVRIPVTTVMRQAQAAILHDTSTRLNAVTAPTLVLHGTADRMLPISNAEHIAGLVPGAQLEVFDGVGHLFWWERTDLSAELVREHCLRSVMSTLATQSATGPAPAVTSAATTHDTENWSQQP